MNRRIQVQWWRRGSREGCSPGWRTATGRLRGEEAERAIAVFFGPPWCVKIRRIVSLEGIRSPDVGALELFCVTSYPLPNTLVYSLHYALYTPYTLVYSLHYAPYTMLSVIKCTIILHQVITFARAQQAPSVTTGLVLCFRPLRGWRSRCGPPSGMKCSGSTPRPS